MRMIEVKRNSINASSFETMGITLVCLTTILGVLAILIVGIFSANFNALGAMNAGYAIICGFCTLLFVLLTARFVYHSISRRKEQSRRGPRIVLPVFCFAAALGLASATIQLAATAMAPVTGEEASTEVPTSFPAL